MITLKRLKELLNYDPETGVFRWRLSRGGKALKGTVAGTLDKDGYTTIHIGGRRYRAGRLAFFYVNGKWPSADVDHEDTDRSNDIFVNLRPATRSQNHANRRVVRCGLKGTYQITRPSGYIGYVAQIRNQGKHTYLGVFSTEQAAHDVYVAAAVRLNGEFARAA